jgi:DNA-binding transcriptional MerR regulator/methylmalonyl-CoA mutase cobalamin-binding subunit
MGISDVERDTGVTRENLRTWERRYGFPAPLRDAGGERAYPADQVEKLRQIKRLMDAGLRPGALVGMSIEALRAKGTAQAAAPQPRTEFTDEIGVMLEAVKACDARNLRARLRWQLAAHGTRRFVTGLVAALNQAVGELWARGELPIHGEHLFAEQIEAVLHTASAQYVAEPAGPRILLATLPGERHKLGLLMLEAVLSAELADCVSLGAQISAIEIAEAASVLKADVVAVSFSSSYPSKAAVQGLAGLRALLPRETAVWAGGECLARLRKRPEGVLMPMTLDTAVAELRKLRH